MSPGPHYKSLATSSGHILDPKTSQHAQDIQPIEIVVVPTDQEEEIQGTVKAEADEENLSQNLFKNLVKN
ncbi:hypothetical protein PCANC_09951 [Puccinia coronata f. sp. avenae]|uniref:Uncharacterized protein n=1 Tax=Puccinia coronata f. sp. avenae TaxID=200324 RepID=A0A2N5V2S6_9BASI|nr:hypothetical protein PCANC_21354 [Puccinia coronata f. sp. avenae]PLW18147.1 hypothetical protein PCASD_19067 [Puccinia coronata f. sp. avenae]PLW41849.1 hypothetical protein PCASD_05521 [Puccinia coronata f. sp. avenae]PLW44322.1 hypothetical protein PCANC_09951 [Puccinia coronata f. sp. avenae]